jgi:hypothetical protein
MHGTPRELKIAYKRRDRLGGILHYYHRAAA